LPTDVPSRPIGGMFSMSWRRIAMSTLLVLSSVLSN